MKNVIVTKEVLRIYDKYEGDFGLLDERWASPSDHNRLTSEQMVIFAEYVDNLSLVKRDTISAQARERVTARIGELEKVIDDQVIDIMRTRARTGHQMISEFIEIYSYTDSEMATFPYLRKYMESLPDLTTPAGVKKLDKVGFALAGLFLTYRASNHSGAQMTTKESEIDFSRSSIHYIRLANFTSYTGKCFYSVDEYLKLARINFLRMLVGRPEGILKRLARGR